jgi:hypothetical protein
MEQAEVLFGNGHWPKVRGRHGVRYWWVNQNQTFRQEIEGGYHRVIPSK